MTKGQLLTLGEALVDLVATTPGPLADAVGFERAAGGAPANVAVGVARLGQPAGFIGKVGADAFGDHLASTLAAEGVDISGLKRSTMRTAVAFVSLGEDGEREFLFYRHACADMALAPAEIDEAQVVGAAWLHVGSLSMTAEPARSATLHALNVAREAGVPRSVDPNLRLDLWSSEGAAKAAIRELLKYAVVAKVAEDELAFLTGASSVEAAASLLGGETQLVVVTRGAAGTTYVTSAFSGHVPAFSVEAVDTTGAGDAFTAALLSRAMADPGLLTTEGALVGVLRLASAYAALTVTRRGAIPALPTRAELAEFMRGRGE